MIAKLLVFEDYDANLDKLNLVYIEKFNKQIEDILRSLSVIIRRSQLFPKAVSSLKSLNKIIRQIVSHFYF